MVKSHQIRVLFLGMVYFILLAAIFVPHHHHEETACFTTAHCEDDESGHDQHAEEPVDHQHDSREDSKHCLTFEYYVFTDSGKNIKRAFEFKVESFSHHDLFYSCLLSAEESPKTETIFKLSGQLSIQNEFVVFVSHELPLRAPPVAFA
ncbi:MAG: DUF6769 family protein [Bacteroidales bacterium]|jgi:hypothetical protein|nr:DUF6769 family protein [Bacteroidales bacterium]